MNIDDATDLPINECIFCLCEVIGYVDDPDMPFVCEDCKEAE